MKDIKTKELIEMYEMIVNYLKELANNKESLKSDDNA